MEKALLLYKIINNEGVPFPSAGNQLKLSGFTYKAARMGGAPTITGNVRSVDSLEGQWDNVYADFNGERFYVRTEPDNSKDSSSLGETYSVTFYSQRYVLDNVYMIDAVQSDISVDGYQSNSTKVQFMGDIVEWAARLNASFSYTGLASDGWSVVIDSGVSSEDQMMSFEDKFVSEALQEGFNVYNIPYYFAGKVIHFGYTSNVIATPFEYGADNSLLSIQKNNANYKIVNRCSGYGSGDNLPYYYPNLTPKGEVSAEANSANVTLKTENITVSNAARFANKVAITDTITYRKTALSFSGEQVELYNSSTGDYEYRALSDSTVSQLRNKSADVAYIPMKIEVTANASAKYTILFPVWFDAELMTLSNLSGVTVDGVDYTSLVSLNADDSSFELSLAAGTHTIYYTVVASISFDESYLSRVISIGWHATGEPAWYQGATKISDISDIGIKVNVTPTSGDSFRQIIVEGSYIAPVGALMPPIFRSSRGVDRFYNALNGTYEKPGGSGYYSFNHPYKPGDRREQTVSFESIKPTIKGMANAAGQPMDQFLEFAWDANDNDEIDSSTGEYVHPYFFAKLPKYNGDNGFNLFDSASESGTMTISMTSGVCGSCSFEIHVGEDTQKNTVQVDPDGNLLRNDKGEVRCGCKSLGQPKEVPQDRQNDTQSHEVWIALAKDATTYPVVMPSLQRDLVPITDDTFVILNIALPQAYITAAEKKLGQEIIAYMALNNDERFSFSIGFSRIYFEENPTVLAQLNENSKITVRHHSIDREFYISDFTYSMAEGDVLPEITVDLVDELDTASNSLQLRIDAVKQEILNIVGSGDILKEGQRHFLRKDVEDYAKARAHFEKGVTLAPSTLDNDHGDDVGGMLNVATDESMPVGISVSAKSDRDAGGLGKALQIKGYSRFDGDITLTETSRLEGGIRLPVTTIASDGAVHALSAAQRTIIVTGASLSLTLSLPESPANGQEYEVYNTVARTADARLTISGTTIEVVGEPSAASSFDVYGVCVIKLVYSEYRTRWIASMEVMLSSEGTVPVSQLPASTAFFIRHPLNCETLSDGSYRFELSHGMGKRPTVTVTDAEMNEVKVDVQFPDDNTVVLTWSGDPLSGGEIYLV